MKQRVNALKQVYTSEKQVESETAVITETATTTTCILDDKEIARRTGDGLMPNDGYDYSIHLKDLKDEAIGDKVFIPAHGIQFREQDTQSVFQLLQRSKHHLKPDVKHIVLDGAEAHTVDAEIEAQLNSTEDDNFISNEDEDWDTYIRELNEAK
jgi:hypothetical protein